MGIGKALYRNGTSIQAIREYMGYSMDETVKKYIGWADEEVDRKSEELSVLPLRTGWR